MSGADASEQHGSLTTRAALFSVSAALFLLILKAAAAWRTGSVAMLGSLADTGLDLLASMITLYGVRLAARPPDRNHRFGHGKAEAVAALFQVGIISFSAIAIAWRATERLTLGEKTTDAAIGIAVSLVAMTLTLLLLAYQRMVIRRTGSIAIRTDHLHYKSDLLLNFSVIVALALDQYAGFAGADPLFGLAIALWLGWNAWNASTDAIDQLMDKEWPEEKRQELLAIAGGHPEIAGVHDLRTRTSGSHDFAQFHVWLDPHMTVKEAHRVIEEIEHRIETAFPGIEVIIHFDPRGQVDQPGNRLAETDETAIVEDKTT
jgi:ferrous-iron efflux pump FieF